VLFSQQACVAWFGEIRAYAWLIGISLLIGDLFLPIPATGVMAALGSVYGVLPGALFSIIGSTMAGFLGYWLARFIGTKATRYLASPAELDRFRQLFDAWGGIAIIISRTMPILPEVVSILAGFAGMSMVRFSTALLFGTVPTCFFFASLGTGVWLDPAWGMTVAVILPLIIWPVFIRFALPQKKVLTDTIDKGNC
jgi:uncharacterized membrane protein YdjX (TVP38/TMEM64 family)